MAGLDWVLLGLRVLTIIILYVFLGVAFYIIWRDLKQAGVQTPVQPEPPRQLRVIASAEDQPLGVGQTLLLQSITHLGRHPDNVIVLNDVSVSGCHACISQKNGVWWLEDLNSRNGTTLNELPLSKPASLADGDIIGIGNTRFKLERVS